MKMLNDSMSLSQDRILYRDKLSSPIDCTIYQAVESVKHSDHKPVIAQFRIKLKPGFAG